MMVFSFSIFLEEELSNSLMGSNYKLKYIFYEGTVRKMWTHRFMLQHWYTPPPQKKKIKDAATENQGFQVGHVNSVML